MQLPVGEEKDFRGVVDLVRMKAYLSKGDDKGTHEEKDVPADMKDEVEAARSALVEMVAEVDDALMEKYLETGALSPEEFLAGLKLSVVSGKVFPVLAVSGVRNVARETADGRSRRSRLRRPMRARKWKARTRMETR